MKCPFCSAPDSRVIDSRVGKDGSNIRRRRECEQCLKRFTTYEQLEELLPFVVKKDGRREPYDRNKILLGMQKACEKRPVSIETIESLVGNIEGQLLELAQREVSSNQLGELVMQQLKLIDDVAYIRFASVYRAFQDIGEFVDLIRDHETQVEKL